MTYNDLLEILSKLEPEQLEQDVTVHVVCDDIYIPLSRVLESGIGNDVLDEGHIYLEIQ